MNICIVCTGNTCRSPLAEAIFRSYKIPNMHVKSAGLHALDGLPISEKSRYLIEQESMPYTKTSQQISSDSIEWATYVFTMTEGHKNSLQQLFPEAKEKIFTLKEFIQEDGDLDVHDPFGGDLKVYEQTFSELKEVIGKAVKKLVGG